LSQFATILIRITLLITFAIWWGGFTFYAAIVVPVGSEILGSARTQGFITQVVTHWLNLAAALTILMMAVDSWLNRRTRKKVGFFIQLGATIASFICLAVLVYLHPRMDELINFSGETISDEAKFYEIHRVYLWVSSVQWVLGAVWMAFIAIRFSDGKQISTKEPTHQ
jgi:hypothetical protein